MDVTPAPAGDELPLKAPVVNVVDPAATEDGGVSSNFEKTPVSVEDASQLETETSDDDSEEDWETQSLYEDGLQSIKDDQLLDSMFSICLILLHG